MGYREDDVVVVGFYSAVTCTVLDSVWRRSTDRRPSIRVTLALVWDSTFYRRNIDEVFDDDKYDHNLPQLHDYEERRSGQKKQMGIDLGDELGRHRSDDYADFSYDADYFCGQQEGWGAAIF
jgi:hypothetical protein